MILASKPFVKKQNKVSLHQLSHARLKINQDLIVSFLSMNIVDSVIYFNRRTYFSTECQNYFFFLLLTLTLKFDKSFLINPFSFERLVEFWMATKHFFYVDETFKIWIANLIWFESHIWQRQKKVSFKCHTLHLKKRNIQFSENSLVSLMFGNYVSLFTF